MITLVEKKVFKEIKLEVWHAVKRRLRDPLLTRAILQLDGQRTTRSSI